MIGRTKGGMNNKLHAICESQGRPLDLFVAAGQVSDGIGARALLSSLPKVDWLLGDRGYDADWCREASQDKGMRACIPGWKQRKTPAKNDKRRYKRRNRIEIMFGRPEVWGGRGDPLRPLPEGLPIGHRTRRYRYLLVMNPDPSAPAAR